MASKEERLDQLQMGFHWLMDEYATYLSSLRGGAMNREGTRKHLRVVSDGCLLNTPT